MTNVKSSQREIKLSLIRVNPYRDAMHKEGGQILSRVIKDDEAHGILGGDATLVAVEELVLADLARRGFVLHHRRIVLHVHVGEGVRAALVAQKERVARAVVAGPLGPAAHTHQSAIGVLAASGADTLGDDGAASPASEMYHLGASVGLLVMVGNGHAVEFGLAVVA